ncbi:Uma2 family endonuclease [Desulfonema magnum]|uniref:DUF820 n=1 Tax=Desulfonema magnum TaxID=45655 RepID=A0A975BXT0_9BACT|nr:Uma2 family endonuclease [Desulfonema magnum]QTA93322.1 DUF820 [Desulfonema magnum]
MQQQAVSMISEAEYIEQERTAEIKSEYYQGEIFAMAGASRKHNLIVANVIGELRYQLKNKPCRTYPSDMRLKTEATGLYTYPDVMVVCGDEKFTDERQDTLLNPDVIIEVLSDSTESYDRGRKFQNYRKVGSLKEYVMISQHCRKIERFHKNEKQQWVLTESDKENPSVFLESIGCELELSEIYDKTEDISS